MPPPAQLSGVSHREVQGARREFEAHYLHTWRDTNRAADRDWTHLPEIPTGEEILRSIEAGSQPETNDAEAQDAKTQNDKPNPLCDPNLATNIIKGSWPAKIPYLKSHFEILRADAVAPLRVAVKNFRALPSRMEDSDTRIYYSVFITGLFLSRIGIAVRVEFSTERTLKKIKWEQSTRLLQGTMVALSPASDQFRSICKVATVAARPILGGLDQNPPTVDLFWRDMDEFDFNPLEEWIMVEGSQGYFEASRHMLVALQKAVTERSHLSRYVVKLDRTMKPPDYIASNPTLDLTPLDLSNKWPLIDLSDDLDRLDLSAVDVVQSFPEYIDNGMDISQLMACKAVLTQSVAIVQGPPGTGKTFVTIAALRVLVHNMRNGDPPIIVAAQTNNALDQLLNHILTFEPNIVRLGGRSEKGNTEIRKRTLYKLREASPELIDARHDMKQCSIDYKNICTDVQEILAPLKYGGILNPQVLVQNKVITEAQESTLPLNGSTRDLRSWLDIDGIKPMPRSRGVPKTTEVDDIESEELDFLQNNLAAMRDDAELESLQGFWVPFARTETSSSLISASSSAAIKDSLRSVPDLNQIAPSQRNLWYRVMELNLMDTIRMKLRDSLAKYQKVIQEYQVAKAMSNYRLISFLDIKVIGCTTTGLAKYRPLIAALRPKTLFIEEASETLEGTIAAGLVHSIEHLVLVGDHKQLQPTCNIKALEKAPYHMNVSMFERLINNDFPYVFLKEQHRMVPEIRELLTIEPEPFYNGLTDHVSVLDRRVNRPPVPGMGGLNVFFFDHKWPESIDADLSRWNGEESKMITGFFNHLVLNGTEASKITVLTFYNGQRKNILRDLRYNEGLKHITDFNVFTVDSYQGEENDTVLLSLVRSNQESSIGFLASENRAIVSLSRARRGLYLFGNTSMLSSPEMNKNLMFRATPWDPIIKFLRENGQLAMDQGLPVTCVNHKEMTSITEPEDWNGLAGGCKKMCDSQLECGHPCWLACHPFSHLEVKCKAACPMILLCGHGCSRCCGEICVCDGCAIKASDPKDNPSKSGGETVDRSNITPQKEVADVERNLSKTPFPSIYGTPAVRSIIQGSAAIQGQYNGAGAQRGTGRGHQFPARSRSTYAPATRGAAYPRASTQYRGQGRGGSRGHTGSPGRGGGRGRGSNPGKMDAGRIDALQDGEYSMTSFPLRGLNRETNLSQPGGIRGHGSQSSTASRFVSNSPDDRTPRTVEDSPSCGSPLHKVKTAIATSSAAWQDWDPVVADKQLAEEVRSKLESTPDANTMIKEKFIRADIGEGGTRKKQRCHVTDLISFDGPNERDEKSHDKSRDIGDVGEKGDFQCSSERPSFSTKNLSSGGDPSTVADVPGPSEHSKALAGSTMAEKLATSESSGSQSVNVRGNERLGHCRNRHGGAQPYRIASPTVRAPVSTPAFSGKLQGINEDEDEKT